VFPEEMCSVAHGVKAAGARTTSSFMAGTAVIGERVPHAGGYLDGRLQSLVGVEHLPDVARAAASGLRNDMPQPID
jgi:hypothetical protein